jgi:hypothetical protein
MGKSKPLNLTRPRALHNRDLDILLKHRPDQIELCEGEFRVIAGKFQNKLHEH